MAIPELDPGTSVACGEGRTDSRIYAPATGTAKAVMIFVDFPSTRGHVPPADVANHLLGGDGARNTYFDQSHENLTLNVAVRSDLGWRTMPKDSELFNFWNPLSVDRHRDYIAAAAGLFKNAVNFKDFRFVYIVAPEEAALPLSPAFTVFPTQGAKLGGGREITLAVTFGRDSYTNTFINLVHETGHLFGLPDLYPGGGFAEDSTAGCWCIMSDIFRASGFIGWHRHKNNWLADARKQYVRQPATTRALLTPLTERSGVSMLVFPAGGDPNGPSRVWVVEVAQPVFAKGSGLISPVEGVLLYSVDATLESGKSPVKVIPRLQSKSTDFGNLFEAPFRPGDPRITVSMNGRSLTLEVLGKSGTAYDVQTTFA